MRSWRVSVLLLTLVMLVPGSPRAANPVVAGAGTAVVTFTYMPAGWWGRANPVKFNAIVLDGLVAHQDAGPMTSPLTAYNVRGAVTDAGPPQLGKIDPFILYTGVSILDVCNPIPDGDGCLGDFYQTHVKLVCDSGSFTKLIATLELIIPCRVRVQKLKPVVEDNGQTIGVVGGKTHTARGTLVIRAAVTRDEPALANEKYYAAGVFFIQPSVP